MISGTEVTQVVINLERPLAVVGNIYSLVMMVNVNYTYFNIYKSCLI